MRESRGGTCDARKKIWSRYLDTLTSRPASSFFHPYAAAFEEVGYTGAVIIHGVEEVDVGTIGLVAPRKVEDHRKL